MAEEERNLLLDPITDGFQSITDDIAEKSGFNRLLDSWGSAVSGFFASIGSRIADFASRLLSSAGNTVGGWLGAPDLSAMDVIDDTAEDESARIQLDVINTGQTIDTAAITQIVAEEIEAAGSGLSRALSYVPVRFSSDADKDAQYLAGRAKAAAEATYERVIRQTTTDAYARLAKTIYETDTPTAEQIAAVTTAVNANTQARGMVDAFVVAEAEAISGLRKNSSGQLTVNTGGVYATVLAALTSDSETPITSIANVGTHSVTLADATGLVRSQLDRQIAFESIPTAVRAALEPAQAQIIQAKINEGTFPTAAFGALDANSAQVLVAAITGERDNSLIDQALRTASSISIEDGRLIVVDANGDTAPALQLTPPVAAATDSAIVPGA